MTKFTSVSIIMLGAIVTILLFVAVDLTSAWKRDFFARSSPKSNEIADTVDVSNENVAKNFKSSHAELVAAMMPQRKALHCHYGVDMFRSNNETADGAFEQVRCDDDDYDRCLVGKCKGQNFVEVRKYCTTKGGCAAFGCAVDEELECKTCFGDMCNA